MESSQNAIASIITSNYIPQALTLYSYIQESNPAVDFLALVLGERDSMPQDLPPGPEWIYWDEFVDRETRFKLASEYTPFELSCVVRGRFHHYLGTKRKFNKWVMVDTDIGILASLDPIWEALETSCIALTPHASKPVRLDQAYPHERNFLKHGLFNAGVLGMKRSDSATEASRWMGERLEAYGHSFADRQASGLPNFHDFEFVDQIWLNLLPLYFRDSTVILDREGYNLGHWNIHQDKLELQDGVAYFNGNRVVMAHFSGLPSKEELDLVTYHSDLYTKNRCRPWAILAKNYLDRLEWAKINTPSIPYSYSNIQPGYRKEEEEPASLVALNSTKALPKRVLQKVAYVLKSPSKIVGGIKFLSWQLKRSFETAQALVMNRGADRIFRDRSENAFTKLIPCIGNYETYLVRASILQAVEQAKDQFHGKLLDVGAGSSPYEELIIATGKVSQYIKLDFAKSDYHKGHHLDLTWDGKTIPLDRHSIDSVIMTEVLEHVHRPGELLQEVRRVLKPGGVLFLTVPFIWPMHELPYDYHRFTPIALRTYLEEADFNVQSIQILGGWDHSLAQQLGLWLTNRSMGARKRKLAKLLAWPFYSFLLRRGKDEFTTIRNHQMHIGLAGVSIAGR
jgi:SAM-dependent methyltransferase